LGYLTASVAALGGLPFGYDDGVISGALIFLRSAMSLSPIMHGVAVAIALAGTGAGAAMVGHLSNRAGRQQVTARRERAD
jgi:MFS family permease